MSAREVFPEENRVVERFSPGRSDQLKEHAYFRISASHPTEYVSKFFSDARADGLHTREFKVNL